MQNYHLTCNNIDRRIGKVYSLLGFVIRCSKKIQGSMCTYNALLLLCQYGSVARCLHYDIHIKSIGSINIVLPPYKDTVDHDLLLEELGKAGIREVAQSYLTSRRQYVSVNNKLYTQNDIS